MLLLISLLEWNVWWNNILNIVKHLNVGMLVLILQYSNYQCIWCFFILIELLVENSCMLTRKWHNWYNLMIMWPRCWNRTSSWWLPGSSIPSLMCVSMVSCNSQVLNTKTNLPSVFLTAFGFGCRLVHISMEFYQQEKLLCLACWPSHHLNMTGPAMLQGSACNVYSWLIAV